MFVQLKFKIKLNYKWSVKWEKNNKVSKERERYGGRDVHSGTTGGKETGTGTGEYGSGINRP